ncbi:MAG: protein kinase [candidate division Zixibacteria bacterium]|nr:protein kinase [candidate division Zixibacteria bacterium]
MAPDDDKTHTYVPLISGTMISHYRTIERIGAGGMGEVYLAEDTELNRKVALKFLPLHLCQDADCRARFKREAQAAAKLDHPNIVSVFEVGELQGRPFFSMQHVEGQSLKEVIAEKTLPLDRIFEIGIQVCEGLQAAHESGIAHRDIKPSNILIDSHGRARIVDFGLASVMGSDHLTKTGSTLGTIGYMSPEQVRGDKVDYRTDLFSFGVVLYEMITGHAPFKADSEAATLHAIANTKPELLARYRREIPVELQTIADKALEKNVATRYQHADDMSTDLKRLTSRNPAQPSKKRTGPRIAWSSVLIVALIAGVMVLKPWRIVIKPADEAQAATKRVVVVPFKNQTGDPSLDPLGRMVADWTTQSLMQTGLAEVVPPEVYPDFDSRTGIKPIIEATGAKMVVTGSYYQISDSLQFQAQVMSEDGTLLQAVEPVNVPKARVMEGVEEVRQKTVGGLAVLLDDRTLGTSARSARPPKYEAYKEFMEGRMYHLEQRNDSAALVHYERAYALDTNFLEALLFKTAVAANLGQNAKWDSAVQLLQKRREQLTTLQQLKLDEAAAGLVGNTAAKLEASRKGALLAPGSNFSYMQAYCALEANRPAECIKALEEINPDRGWARGFRLYWANMTIAYHRLGQHDKELKAARRSRQLFSDHPGALFYLTRALVAKGEINEAESVLELLLAQPQNNIGAWLIYSVGEMRAHGHEDLAMKWSARAVQWYEARPTGEQKANCKSYGDALYSARRWVDSKRVFEKLAAEEPDNVDYRAYLGWIAARLGDKETARQVSDWLRDLNRPYLNGVNTYYRTCISCLLGEKEEAMRLLQESIRQGYGQYDAFHSDPDLELLWDYPPFIELMKPKG